MSRKILLTAKAAVWAGCLAPLAGLTSLALTGGLGANPIEFLLLATGKTAIIILVVSLAISPLRRWTAQNWLIRFRRPLGLFAFFYALLHFAVYAGLDKYFDLRDITEDIARRPFIMAGALCLLLLVPLAATSTAGAVRRLGGRRWQALHRLVYIAAPAGLLHFWWKQKADISNPAILGAILALLLAERIAHRFLRRNPGA